MKPSRIYIERFVRENAGKITDREMAAELGISPKTVRNVAENYRISLRLTANVERKKRVEQAVREHYKTHTCGDIARLTGEKHSYVHHVAKRLGLKLVEKQYKKKPEPKSDGFFRSPVGFNWLLGFRA